MTDELENNLAYLQKWQRDFDPEKISRLDKFLHDYFRGGRVKSKFDIVPFAIEDKQAQFVDTNFYYRVGGVDPEKAKEHNDILAIQWGIGSRKANTFEDQVAIANDKSIPYISWIIFDPADPMPIYQQASNYASDPHVISNPMRIDVEKPRSTTRCINYTELETIVSILKIESAFKVGAYSRVNIFEEIFPNGFPDWMEDVYQWIAQYLLFYKDGKWIQARYYDDYLNNGWEWSLPPAVTKSQLYKDQRWRDLVEAWQITDYGNAEYYIAKQWISPGQPGMKSCDLNLSMKSSMIFISNLFSGYTPPQPPITDCVWKFTATGNVNYRTQPLVSTSTYAGTFTSGTTVNSIGLSNPRYGEFWLKFKIDGKTYFTALWYSGKQYYVPMD